MSNNNALTLAVVMSGLAAASYRFGYTGKGIAIVAIMAACVFAVWPIRLKWGLAGKEQWREIRPKGRTHFVITHGVAFCGVLAVWTMATDYVAYSQLPRYWAGQLYAMLCGGCIGGLWEWRARERKYSEVKSFREMLTAVGLRKGE